MRGTLKLARIRDIDVGLHYSWFFVVVAFTVILAEVQLPNQYDDWSEAQYWVVGFLSVLLLFFSVLLHEFGHALVAQSRGVPVESITLFIFGGIAGLAQDSDEAFDEFLIAVAGPIVSVLLGGAFGLLWLLFGDISEQSAALFGYLAYINIILAVFNLIPGFPLDGGRVLRAILWGALDNMRRATQIAVAIGTGVGMLFIFLGVLMIIGGYLGNGIWAVVIGWFLQNAAGSSLEQVEQQQAFRGVTVADLMDAEPITVAPSVDLETLAEEYILGRNARGLPVIYDGQMIGLITVNDLKDVPRERWPVTRVNDAMTPRRLLKIASPETPLEDALQMMADGDFHQVPVVIQDRFVGLLTRFEVLRYLNMRNELGVDR